MSTQTAAGGTPAAKIKLYVIPTHPCRTGMLMLAHKGIPYRQVDLPAGLRAVAGELGEATSLPDIGVSETDPDDPKQEILFTKPANVEQARIVKETLAYLSTSKKKTSAAR